MPELRSLQKKESRLPLIVTPPAAASKRRGIVRAFAVFAPLAVEVNLQPDQKMACHRD